VRTFFHRYFHGMAAAWLVLGVALSAVGFEFWRVRTSALWRDHRRFQDEVGATQGELAARVDRYEEFTSTLRRQIEACDRLTETDWQRIAGGVDWNDPYYSLLSGFAYADW
jgi:hypothetical protein